jgi:hypothetical protein
MARPGEARQDKDFNFILETARRGRAWQGWARRGTAGLGGARQGKARILLFTELKMLHEKSSDTKILENVLNEAKVGDTITYADLSKAIGRDVRTHAQGALNTARKTMLANGMVFGTERTVGLTRMNDFQIVDSIESDRLRVQRIGKRSITKLGKVKFESLDNDQKRKHTTMAAQMGAITMFAAKSSTNKIESSVKANSETLAIGETLSLFTK